jgi:predicted permease
MLRDLLWTLRWLRKNRLFTAAITAILALGIGANTAVFSIVDAVLLRPLPYTSAARLIQLEERSPKRQIYSLPATDYLRWTARHDLFEKIAAYSTKDIVTMTGVGEPDQVMTQPTEVGLFSLLGVGARLGRTLRDSEGEAVLSDRLWRRRFQADPGVVGRTITLSDQVFTIVGVMPPEFEFPYPDVEMWTPLRLTPASTIGVQVVAQMQPRVGLPQIQSAMEIVARQLEREDPQAKAGLQIAVSPWRETTWRQYELTLVFVLAAVGLVLLIACADVSSLLLSRALQRQKEIAIRASLGAGFWRVLRQLLAESLVLAVLGSAAGIAVAHWALRFLLRGITALPTALPHIQRVALNGRVLLFNTGLCLLLACLFSLAPVFMASRTDLQSVLRGGQGGGPKSSSRLFSFLIAAEAAFAFLLLVGSGLMVRSLIRLQQADHGFRPDHVLTMRVPIGSLRQPRPRGKYDTKPRQMAFYAELVDHLSKVPGVRAAAVVNNLPLSEANTTTAHRGPDGELVGTPTRTISPQYFSAMGIPLLAGRLFSEADQADAPQVAIVNQALARQWFPTRDPVGQIVRDEPGNPITIVGVVKDAPQRNYERPPQGEIYRPYRQAMFGVFLSTIVVRTSGDPLPLAATLRSEVWAVEPNQPIVKVETLEDVVADAIWRPRFSAWIFSVLGSLAVLLTSAGVYGVVSYTVSLRTREVGIRVALGASPRNVAALILRGAMAPLAAGLAVGLVAAVFVSRLLASLLYELSNTDAPTYLAAAVLLLAIGAAASTRPAWKAATGDPLTALRTE